MDEYIANSIELRKKAIFDYYDVKNKNILEKVDDLFFRINELGISSSDVNDFENKFANSELNTEYINLITEVATTCKLKKEYKDGMKKEDIKEYAKESIKSDAKHYAEEAYRDTRSVVDRSFGITEKIRRTPILGTVWEIDNQTNIIGNFKDKIKSKRKLKKELEKEIELANNEETEDN